MSRHLKKEFQRLENMQAAIFQQMQRYQNQTMKELCDRQQLKKRQQQRMLQIKKKAPKELVTNPHNNGVWVELANFLDEQQFIDLSEIEQRKRERELIRAQMDRKRAAVQAVGVIQHQTLSWKQLDKNQEVVAKAPWKLMRELRRKEVAENKARFERIEQNKRDKVSHYHKY